MQLALLQTIKQSITQLITIFHLNLNEKKNPQGRPLKIQNVDALALAVYQHTSTRATKKSVFDDLEATLNCSYKTFVCAMNRAGAWAMRILFLLMRLGKKFGHIVKYTDATDLPVCRKKNADSNKTMRGIAEIGRSSKGWYHGVKMTMTRDAMGNILGLRFTSPRTNDRTIFRSINKDIFGVIIADAGYVSKQLERDMDIDGKRWVMIRPFESMKKLATKWQEKLYRSRFQIEFDFRSMKLFHGLVTSLPRSVNGMIANYLNAIFSFVIA
jgi:transposase